MPQNGFRKYLASGKVQEEIFFWGGICLQYDYRDLYIKITSDLYIKISSDLYIKISSDLYT